MNTAPNASRGPRRPWLWAGLALGVVTCGGGSCVFGLLVIGLAGQGGTPGTSPSAEVGLESFRRTLARVRANVPTSTAVADVPCPDPEMLRAAGSGVSRGAQDEAKLWTRKVSYESLADFVDKGQTTLERPLPGVLPNREELGFEPAPPAGPDDWQWLEDGGLAEVFHPNLYEGYYREDSLKGTLRDVFAHRYLLVLRASTRSMPRIRDRGIQLDVLDRRRELRSGESFAPGVFQGALVVMDVDTAAVTCRATLDAQSSTSIVYRNRSGLGGMRQTPSEELKSDFKDRYREAARAALGHISKLLDVSW